MVDEPDARRAREVAVAPTVVATEIGACSPPDHAADGSEPEPTELGRGDLVGRYLIVERLGVGGMGVVYSA